MIRALLKKQLLELGAAFVRSSKLASGAPGRRFKESIKQRLAVINGEINTLRSDSQWHTPLALFYTALLSLSGTLWFLAVCQLFRIFLCEKSTRVLGVVA